MFLLVQGYYKHVLPPIENKCLGFELRREYIETNNQQINISSSIIRKDHETDILKPTKI